VSNHATDVVDVDLDIDLVGGFDGNVYMDMVTTR
jgi:hypothetical protein